MTSSNVMAELFMAWLVDGDEVALQAHLDNLADIPAYNYTREDLEFVLRDFRKNHQLVSAFRRIQQKRKEVSK